MNEATLLLRHIKNPIFVQAGMVISSVWMPRKQDNGFLSVYDGSKIGPEESAIHQKEVFKSPSVAVSAVTCGECKKLGPQNTWDLSVIEAPLENCSEHVHIDFNGLPSKSAYRVAAEALRDRANSRGLLWENKQ